MKKEHWSDCAVHNAPAYEPSDCDCGGLELADDPGHNLVAPLVASPRRLGAVFGDGCAGGFIKPQELPSDPLIADTTATNLPNAHDGVVVFGDADRVDLDASGIAVVSQLKDTAGS